MKEIWRYKSFNHFGEAFIPVIACLFIKAENVRSVLLSFAIVYFLFRAVLFWSELRTSKKIQKRGVFVLGVLEQDSIKTHVFMKSSYILEANVKYYDEEKKMTLKFHGYDICDSKEIGYGKLKEIRNREEDVEVLVGYLPEKPEICEVYLKDAFEKI